MKNEVVICTIFYEDQAHFSLSVCCYPAWIEGVKLKLAGGFSKMGRMGPEYGRGDKGNKEEREQWKSQGTVAGNTKGLWGNNREAIYWEISLPGSNKTSKVYLVWPKPEIKGNTKSLKSPAQGERGVETATGDESLTEMQGILQGLLVTPIPVGDMFGLRGTFPSLARKEQSVGKNPGA